MALRRAWQIYPATYRAREIEILSGWIEAGESGSVIGLAGAGKSNLLGFLSHRPEVVTQYLKQNSLRLAIVYVDLNSLPQNDLATLYRVILRSMYEARIQWVNLDPSLEPGQTSLAATVETLYRKVEDKTEPFMVQSVLREVLLWLMEHQVRLVLVFDPFDQFCRVATTQVLDNLRGLRDSFKNTLSYLVGLRQELTDLRNPLELGELLEILDTFVCWVGPMEVDDARWVIHQVEAASQQQLSKTQVNQLIDLTGGYPALLKIASQWAVQLSADPKMNICEDELLAEPSIQNRLQDLRQGLTGEEEAALSALQRTLALQSNQARLESLRQIEDKHKPALSRLKAKQLCWQADSEWQIFSPLLAKFVAGIDWSCQGKIWYDAATNRFFQGEMELSDLSEKDRRLLHYFWHNPLVVHPIDNLIETIWREDEASWVSNATVQQAIRHLRKQIEPNPAKPCYLINERGAGYRFFPDGTPRE